MRMLTDASVAPFAIHHAFLRQEHYADIEDYLDAVAIVWGDSEADAIVTQIAQDDHYTQETRAYIPAHGGRLAGYSPEAFLNSLPEPDFLTCIEIGQRMIRDLSVRSHFPSSANRLCERRGIPYRVAGSTSSVEFLWAGDAIVEEEAIQPALSALADPRLAEGPGEEFATARRELREGTPAALKQAVAEASNAVESALKVLLTEHGQPVPASQNVDQLFVACKAANLFPPAADGKGVPVEQILVGPTRFGNRRGRHGGGPVPHNVERDEAEAVVASAAVAITFIAKRLPPPRDSSS
jgi:hypothetical protein